MKELNELVELAKFVADWHGGDWSSALCQDKDGKQAHEIICESRSEAVISTGSNSNEASWLCDYLELCSPENILAIAEAFREMGQRAEAAEAESERWKEEAIKAHEESEVVLAKLAELEKQEHYVEVMQDGPMTFCHWMKPANELPNGAKLFAQPAPAVSLAELVPMEIPRDVYKVIYDQCGGFVETAANAQLIWQAARATILRKIEEATLKTTNP